MAEAGLHHGATIFKNVQTVAQLEAQAASNLTGVDRLSGRVADFAGSTKFLLSHAAWFAIWVATNRFSSHPIDPYPFTFLTFLVSLEAIFLSSFVLISQNHMERQAHRRAALDLQINLLAEQEMTMVLKMLQRLCEKAGVQAEIPNNELQSLVEETDPHKLMQYLQKSMPDS